MEKSSRGSSSKPTAPPSFFVRTFGLLKLPAKLVILHNFFFFVLAISVYLSVIPIFSDHIASARDRIKLLRLERDWSLKNLAAATRLSVSQTSSLERGANLPSIESLLAIAAALSASPQKYFRLSASDEL